MAQPRPDISGGFLPIVQFNNSSETSSGNAVSTEAGTESENTVEDVTQ